MNRNDEHKPTQIPTGRRRFSDPELIRMMNAKPPQTPTATRRFSDPESNPIPTGAQP